MAERQLRQILDQLAAASGPASPYKSHSQSHSHSHTHSHSLSNTHSPSHPLATPSHTRRRNSDTEHKDKDRDRVAKGGRLTAHSLLSSILHPKMTGSPGSAVAALPHVQAPAQAQASTNPKQAHSSVSPGLSTARLTSLLDMLSFTGKRKGPPGLSLSPKTSPSSTPKSHSTARSAADEDEEEIIGIDSERRDSGSISDATSPTDSTPSSSPDASPSSDTDPDASPLLTSHCADMDRHWTPRSYDSGQSMVPVPVSRSCLGPRPAPLGRGSKRVRFSDVIVVVG